MGRIVKSFWFTEAGDDKPIGIVIIQPEVGFRKAYIGRGVSDISDERADAEYIARFGAKIYSTMLKEVLAELEKGGK